VQGRLPEGLKAVEDAELRQFIELCICHTPERRPDVRKLLKHSFFEDIRKAAEKEKKEREMEKVGENSEPPAAQPRDLSPTGVVSHREQCPTVSSVEKLDAVCRELSAYAYQHYSIKQLRHTCNQAKCGRMNVFEPCP
jgi:hypothetical protein